MVGSTQMNPTKDNVDNAVNSKYPTTLIELLQLQDL